jgi:peroxisomal coenzyme A diphosphatase NUDT7
MEPFLASSRLLVVPVVALLTKNDIVGQLEASVDEVACIFNHPLQALLDPTLVKNEDSELVPIGSENWPYETEYHVWMRELVLKICPLITDTEYDRYTSAIMG